MALYDTSNLTDRCNRCVTTLADLGPTQGYDVPPLECHDFLMRYLTSNEFSASFGFSIYGVKIEQYHISSFFSVCITICITLLANKIESVFGGDDDDSQE